MYSIANRIVSGLLAIGRFLSVYVLVGLGVSPGDTHAQVSPAYIEADNKVFLRTSTGSLLLQYSLSPTSADDIQGVAGDSAGNFFVGLSCHDGENPPTGKLIRNGLTIASFAEEVVDVDVACDGTVYVATLHEVLVSSPGSSSFSLAWVGSPSLIEEVDAVAATCTGFYISVDYAESGGAILLNGTSVVAGNANDVDATCKGEVYYSSGSSVYKLGSPSAVYTLPAGMGETFAGVGADSSCNFIATVDRSNLYVINGVVSAIGGATSIGDVDFVDSSAGQEVIWPIPSDLPGCASPDTSTLLFSLTDDVGNRIELTCEPGIPGAPEILWGYRLWLIPAGGGPAVFLGRCPYGCGVNSVAIFVSGDDCPTNGNPDRFIRTRYSSIDHGTDDDTDGFVDETVYTYDFLSSKLTTRHLHHSGPELTCPGASESAKGGAGSLGLSSLPPPPVLVFEGEYGPSPEDPSPSPAPPLGEPMHLGYHLPPTLLYSAALGTCSGDLGYYPLADFDGTGCVSALDQELIMGASIASSNDSLSLLTGGVHTIQAIAGSEFAGDFYWVLGSASGTEPGIPTALGVSLPLVPDGYFFLTISNPFTTFFAGFIGLLDSDGLATPGFVLPPGSDPTLAGIVLNHAYVVVDVTSLGSTFVSGPVALELTP